jgi:hypothetical protein
MTNTPQTISWTETDTYSSCTSTDTSLTAGSSVLSMTSSGLTCSGGGIVLPTNSDPVDYTISWNNSQSSTVTLTSGSNVLILGSEQATLLGTVTSGEFTGAAVTLILTYAVLNPLLCGTSQGVTSQSGTAVVEIVGT